MAMSAMPRGVQKGAAEAVSIESYVKPGCKFAAGAAGWVSWAGLCGGRRRAEVFFDSFSGLSRDRSHHVMCTCAKYVLFHCFFVF